MLVHSYGLRHYLTEIGWFRSIDCGLPVDREGNSLPWFTYSAIFFLESKIKPYFHVFEYGSGNSTFWWSKRVSSVITYEHDLDWYNNSKDKFPENVECVYCKLDHNKEYSKGILKYKDKFNIIVIDGRDRVNCAINSLGALKEDGVIIWDNSDREQYKEGYAYLLQNNFKRLDFEGLGPISNCKWCTSIFYRDNNCLDI